MDSLLAWKFMLVAYPITVLLEFPALWFGLARRHSSQRRFVAAFWLTACTYPIVILVLPIALQEYPEWLMVTVAEIFAPLAECAVFLGAYGAVSWRRDCIAIVCANLVSFGVGEVLHAFDFFGGLVS